jgi:hypothetical protein
MFADFSEQIANISADIKRRGLNSSDDLGGVSAADIKGSNFKYLGYNFQPSIDFHR